MTGTIKCSFCGGSEFLYKSAMVDEKPMCCPCYFAITKNNSEPFRSVSEYKEELNLENSISFVRRKFYITLKKYCMKFGKKLTDQEIVDMELSECKKLFSIDRSSVSPLQELKLYDHLRRVSTVSLFPRYLSTYELKEIKLPSPSMDNYLRVLKKKITTN